MASRRPASGSMFFNCRSGRVDLARVTSGATRAVVGRGQWLKRPRRVSVATTDGLCPPCGSRALAEIGRHWLAQA